MHSRSWPFLPYPSLSLSPSFLFYLFRYRLSFIFVLLLLFHFSPPPPAPTLCPWAYVTIQQPCDPEGYSVSLNLSFFICKMGTPRCISWGCEKNSTVRSADPGESRAYGAEPSRCWPCSSAQEPLNSVPGEEGAELLPNPVTGYFARE